MFYIDFGIVHIIQIGFRTKMLCLSKAGDSIMLNNDLNARSKYLVHVLIK